MSKTKELLKVLDLPKKELDENRAILQPQYEALYKYQKENEYFGLPHPDCTLGGDRTQMFLADLAFRLRDEILVNAHPQNPQPYRNYKVGLQAVWDKEFGGEHKQCFKPMELYQWFCWRAKPIHWIIAALIAKEKPDAK